MADVHRFCKDVPIGNGRRIACLAKHQKELAPVCQKRVPALQQAFEFGQKQLQKTKEAIAKKKAAEAAKNGGHPSADDDE